MEPRHQLAFLGAAKRLGWAVALAAATASAAHPAVLITRDQALRQIYGARATFRARTAYLTPAQIDAVRQTARAPFDAKRVTWYEAAAGDTVLGVAFVDQSVVRTMSAAVLTALDARGEVKAVEILTWNEPPDYLPRRRWLDAARGLSDPAVVKAGERLPALAGATLSARAIGAAIRRALACRRVLVAGGRAPS